jgi:hypothetical protein
VDFKPSELSLDALNILSTYENMDSNDSTPHDFSGEPSPYDYRLYDNLGFTIGDDTLGSLGDHYQV